MDIAQTPAAPKPEFEEFKKLLGPAISNRYTGGQLLQLQREMYEMANLLLDLYLAKKDDAKRDRKSQAPA